MWPLPPNMTWSFLKAAWFGDSVISSSYLIVSVGNMVSVTHITRNNGRSLLVCVASDVPAIAEVSWYVTAEIEFISVEAYGNVGVLASGMQELIHISEKEWGRNNVVKSVKHFNAVDIFAKCTRIH